MIKILKNTYIYIGSGLIVLSVISTIIFPPNISPEFTGSAVANITFPGIETEVAVEKIKMLATTQPVTVEQKEDAVQLRSAALNDKAYLELSAEITENVGAFNTISFQSFSPSISQEILRKAIIAIIIAMLIIITYVAYTFRKVSKPIASWKYGVVSTIALLHDTIIPVGFFSMLALFTDAMVDTLFVTALLAVLGYSINDTIVIFDRVRERLIENQEKKRKETFEESVEYGVQNSFRRSIYTSISTIIPLILLALLVPVTKFFAFALCIGIIAGTLSSLFFAPRILILWNNIFPEMEKEKKEKTEIEKAEEKLREMIKGKNIL